jgi:peptide deformylase
VFFWGNPQTAVPRTAKITLRPSINTGPTCAGDNPPKTGLVYLLHHPGSHENDGGLCGMWRDRMTIRAILKFPNPALNVPAARVDTFDADLQILAADLLDTMKAAQGIGITAPHIGVSRQLMVIQLSATDEVRYYVNPQIVWASDEMIRHKEGSVSMQDVLEEIERHAQVRVNYQDLNGVEQVTEADGLLSVCLQHEIDQLNGIFWITKLSRLKRDRLIKKYEKVQLVLSRA